ncbi:hypothetical protein [Arthrobacter sp. 18067]|uniref:hypothetical protein n=1 Tax=Arthrobacter sp. 18067 TaxID=2681413 RepID=UPI00135AF4B2|nr:hypothetical protein [Arthrobacter sp. 18067]
MPAYLGIPGALFPVECEAATVEAETTYSFDTTLEGKRKGQYRKGRPRTWSVDMGLSSSEETADVRALDAGEYGPGPFLWISEEAQATNALLPEVATCGPAAAFGSTITVAGALTLPGVGVAGRSLFNSNPALVMDFGTVKSPVIPGQQFTASAWLVGAGAKITLRWYDAAGTLLAGTVTSAGSGVGSVATRLSVTGTAPASAALCLLRATGATRAARPALTWSAGLAAWAPGGGCAAAVVSKLENSPVILGAARSHSGVTFTITEVG